MSHYLGILLWTEVRCSGCNSVMGGEYVRHGRRQMRMVMAEMDKAGWINRRGGAWCPNCQKHFGGALNPQDTAVELPTPFKGAV